MRTQNDLGIFRSRLIEMLNNIFYFRGPHSALCEDHSVDVRITRVNKTLEFPDIERAIEIIFKKVFTRILYEEDVLLYFLCRK